MSFVAAGFLAGLIALAIPWWLHRLETQSDASKVVSSLLLLRAADEPSSRQRKLQHLLLLTVRMILLALAALAFAQPLMEGLGDLSAPGSGASRLVVVDTSASMGRDAAREEAVAVARGLLRGRAALLSAAGQLEVLQPLTDDPATLGAALGQLEFTAAPLRLEGLLGRIDNLAESLAGSGEPVEIHLISDFQASAVPARFNDLVAGVTRPVTLHRVGAAQPNWRVTADASGQISVVGFDTPEAVLPVEVRVDGERLLRSNVVVPPDGAVALELPAIEAQRHDVKLQVRLDVDDGLAVDNSGHFVVPHQQRQPVSLLGESATQLQYVQAALGTDDRLTFSSELDAPVALLIDSVTTEGLSRYLETGGAAFVTVGPGVQRAARVPGLDVRTDLADGRDRVGRVVQIDPGHPALGSVGDWRDVAVYRHLQTDVGNADVLLSLDNGAPLLVEQRIGRGRLLVLLTGLQADWSSLVTEPAFVSFLRDLLGYLGEDLLPASAVAGEAFKVTNRNLQLLDQEGRRLLSLAQSAGGEVITVAQPGFYEVRTGSKDDEYGGRRFLGVGVDPLESALAPVSTDLLQRWQDVLREGPERQASGPAVRTPLQLAPWLLLGLLLLMIVEPLLANSGVVTRPAGARG